MEDFSLLFSTDFCLKTQAINFDKRNINRNYCNKQTLQKLYKVHVMNVISEHIVSVLKFY